MKYSNGEITISPKVIYWIEIPSLIGEHEKIELLKRDIFIIGYDGGIENIFKLVNSKTKFSAYFYNLDRILAVNNVDKENTNNFITNLSTFISKFAPDKSLVHTNSIHENLAQIFREQGLAYVEKNLSDKTTAFKTMISMIKPFFTEQQRIERSSLRLDLLPLKYKVEITNMDNQNAPVIYGVIKDISLNGLGIVLKISKDLSLFKLKDKLSLRMFIQQSILKINLSIIARIDEAKQELGIMYNITDTHMLREDIANRLTSLIYNWLKSLIEKHGKIDTEEVSSQG